MSRQGPLPPRRHVIATLVLTATVTARLAAQSEIWVPAAQIHTIKNQFVAAVSQLAEALAGTYGDEGPRVSSAI